MDLKQSVNFIVSRREQDLLRARSVLADLIKTNQKFRNAELNERNAKLDYALGKISKDEYDHAVSVRESVIDELGVRNALYPSFHCEKCRDTGLIGTKFCECAKTLAISSSGELIRFPLRSFGELNPTLYGENATFIVKTANEIYTIAQKGSSAVRKNINLLGSAGTGKTFLASCFAGECAKQGRSVVFITAFDFFERARKYHTTFTSDKDDLLAPLIDCSVLIIDDLGTESIMKNITVEYLYSIINERQIRKKTTFITSNLNINEFAIRYSERTASRIFDKKLCYTKEFKFDDIRKIKV